jgi:thioredoxin-like negative regulator of GroEL
MNEQASDQGILPGRQVERESGMSGKSRKQQLEELLALDPDDPFLRYGVAMEYASEGNDEEAARRLRELLRVAPTYVPAYQQAAQILLRLGHDEEAKQVLAVGVQQAQQAGNEHAAGEMLGLAASIE